jgi:hypothetical protein
MEKNRNISDEREREQNPLRPDQPTPGGRGKKQQASRVDDGYQNPASGFGNLAAVGARYSGGFSVSSAATKRKSRDNLPESRRAPR